MSEASPRRRRPVAEAAPGPAAVQVEAPAAEPTVEAAAPMSDETPIAQNDLAGANLQIRAGSGLLDDVLVDRIVIPARHRQPTAEGVALIAQNIKQIGLKTPIKLREKMVPTGEVDGGGKPKFKKQLQLVTGAHRLLACQALGHKKIRAVIYGIGLNVSDAEIEQEELSENFARVELSGEERVAHIRRYYDLVKERIAAEGADTTGKGGRKKGSKTGHKGVNAVVAEKLGVHKETVRRAVSGTQRSAASLKPGPAAQPRPAPPPVERVQPSAQVIEVLRLFREAILPHFHNLTKADRDVFGLELVELLDRQNAEGM